MGDLYGAAIMGLFAVVLLCWGLWVEFGRRKPAEAACRWGCTENYAHPECLLHTMPCGCGAPVPAVNGAYADGWGLYCSEAHLRQYGEPYDQYL